MDPAPGPSMAEDVDRRLASALAVQFRHRREALDAGAARVGWKLGIGEAERIGDEIAVGHLTSATLLRSGAGFRNTDSTALHADAEIFVEIGSELARNASTSEARRAIVAYGGALELVDLGNAGERPEMIIADNIFHRAVAFGPPQVRLPAEGLDVRMIVNGEVRASAGAPADLAGRISAAARLLGAVHEQLRPGDRVITGSVVQVSLDSGDDVLADFGPLGRVQLAIAHH
jgi:2-keto-4-pentenoate hydratase